MVKVKEYYRLSAFHSSVQVQVQGYGISLGVPLVLVQSVWSFHVICHYPNNPTMG